MLTYINRKTAAGTRAGWRWAVWSEQGRQGRGGQGWGQAWGGAELVPASLVSRGNAPAFRLMLGAKRVVSLAIQCGGSSPLTKTAMQERHHLWRRWIWPLILCQGGKERGPENEEEEEEIGDGKSTAPLMPGCKMSHLLAITVVAYEKRSEEVAQVPILHEQIRLTAVLGSLWTEFTSTMLSYLHAIQIDSATLVFPPSPSVFFGNSQRVLTLHFALSQGLYCLGQLAAINVHIGMIVASLHSFLTVFYPMKEQYWVRLCNSQP